jgi:putative oxidoreductase
MLEGRIEAVVDTPASIARRAVAWSGSMVEAVSAKLAFRNLVLLAGRLLLAWIFVHEGVFLTMNFGSASAAMVKSGIPVFALILTIALQLAAGIAITVGWQTRLGAAALGLFCVATAVLFHTNFASRNELMHFEKDLAIAGGMLMLLLCGSGTWSVDERLKKIRDA